MKPADFTAYADLLTPPTRRAAYSDRTAWLMAVMSQLAYLPFEGPPNHEDLREIAAAIASKPDIGSVVTALEALVASASDHGDGRATLETALGELRFELIDTFSVVVPASSDSQAFIARVGVDWREGGENDFLVVAFRGTEPRKPGDINTDLRAKLIGAHGVDGAKAKVHEGFYKALENAPAGGQSIRARIDEAIRGQPDTLPVFVTGHSLGGALAVVATRYIANGSRGACYTFGQPRVGNQNFTEQIFTPVYRVVNAADIVPALPLGETFVGVLIGVVAWLRFVPGPIRNWVMNNLHKVKGYRHGGDQRFLTRSERQQRAGEPALYPGLKVYSSPGFFDRWGKSLHNFALFRLGALIRDHSISLYVEKLGAYARQRQQLRRDLNPGIYNTEAPETAGERASKPAASTPAGSKAKTAPGPKTTAKPKPKPKPKS